MGPDIRTRPSMAKTLRHGLSAVAAMLLTACQAPGPAGAGAKQAISRPGNVTPAAWAYANMLADRFEADRAQGGMVGVGSDIKQCHAGATRPRVDRLQLRQCMVFDTFAVRLNAEVDRAMPGFGDLPYYQTHAAVLRANHYGPLAGFNDPEVLSGYLMQGSNTVFAALAARRRA